MNAQLSLGGETQMDEFFNGQHKFDDFCARVRDLFSKDSSGHDWWHTVRVYRNAIRIAKTYTCDSAVVTLAALLHDVDDEKLFAGNDNENARTIMTEFDIPSDLQQKVIHVIRQVSFKGKDTVIPDTLEGKIVQDADRLDAIGAIGIARTFAFGGSRGRRMHEPGEEPNMHLDAAGMKNYQGTTVNHFYEKLLLLKNLMNTDEAKKIAEERDRYMREFLDEFYAEWDGQR